MKTIFQLSFSNYRDFDLVGKLVGKRLIWERGWATVEYDESWVDNLGIAGKSVRHLLEEFDEVYLVTEI